MFGDGFRSIPGPPPLPNLKGPDISGTVAGLRFNPAVEILTGEGETVFRGRDLLDCDSDKEAAPGGILDTGLMPAASIVFKLETWTLGTSGILIAEGLYCGSSQSLYPLWDEGYDKSSLYGLSE